MTKIRNLFPKKWKVLMETSFAHEYYIQAETYEEATKKAEVEIAAVEYLTDLTGKILIDESYTSELITIEEVKGGI